MVKNLEGVQTAVDTMGMSYVPWIGGKAACPGKKYSWTELKTFISQICNA